MVISRQNTTVNEEVLECDNGMKFCYTVQFLIYFHDGINY